MILQTAGREIVYYRHEGDNKPAIVVDPGEIFAVDTELCSGSWLQKPSDIWSEEKSKGPNPTVCVGIRGALPGDILAAEILKIEPEGLGYNCLLDKRINNAVTGHDMEPLPKTVLIKDGFVIWSDRLKLPVKPMIGTIGTSSPEGCPNSYGGFYGGNMDVNEITSATTVYLPVSYPEALLNIGDVHAMQGDGEICNAGGIECRARVTLRTQLMKNDTDQRFVRAENDDFLMAVACLETTDESFYSACGELIRFARSRYDITEEECFRLMSQVMQARCTQFVNPTRSYICKMPKLILEQGYNKK
jgi:acetamidase/formamidase